MSATYRPLAFFPDPFEPRPDLGWSFGLRVVLKLNYLPLSILAIKTFHFYTLDFKLSHLHRKAIEIVVLPY